MNPDTIERNLAFHGVPGRSGNIGHNRFVLADQRIQQAAFSGIGCSVQGDLESVMDQAGRPLVHCLLQCVDQLFQSGFQRIRTFFIRYFLWIIDTGGQAGLKSV